MIVEVKDIKQGDTFIVDGPMWYDGTAELLKFDDKALDLHLNMKATDKFGAIDFVIKDGSVDLNMSLTKDGEYYSLAVTDNYNNGQQLVQNNLKVQYGKTEGGFFSKAKDYVKASNGKDETTFTVNSPGHILIESTAMSFSVELIKN